MVVAGMRRMRAAIARLPVAHGRRVRAYSLHHSVAIRPCEFQPLSVTPAPARAFASHASANVASAEELFAQSLADREPAQALAHFNHLATPPSQLLAQKLAILLAKRGNREHTERAVEVLKSVYMRTNIQPDDFTQLASIYVVDACLRHRLLDAALDIHDEAFNVGVTLDLPAYDALVQALVASDRLDDATEMLRDVSATNDMSPTERSYFPLLEALVEHQDYDSATTLLRDGRARGVEFTSETFHPLVEMAEADEDANDAVVGFLSYVVQVWDEVKLLDDFADALDADDDDDETEHLEGVSIPLSLESNEDDDEDDSDGEENH